MSVWSELFLLPIRNLTDLTSPSLSAMFSTTDAICHSFRYVLFVFKVLRHQLRHFLSNRSTFVDFVTYLRICSSISTKIRSQDVEIFSIGVGCSYLVDGSYQFVAWILSFLKSGGLLEIEASDWLDHWVFDWSVESSWLSFLLLLIVFKATHRWGWFHGFPVSTIAYFDIIIFVAPRLFPCD